MAIRVRALTADEQRRLEQLARSRTASVRLVERAKMVLLSLEGHSVPAIARQLAVCEKTVRPWLRRFNASGLSGLDDLPRPGKPPSYTPEERSEVVVAALSDPKDLGLPFGSWTLDRLQAYLNEHKGIGIKRSRISEILVAEGLRWRAQETWFSEKAALGGGETKETEAKEHPLDPAFAEKRGPSKACASRRPKEAP